jgi:hypothetical protein
LLPAIAAQFVFAQNPAIAQSQRGAWNHIAALVQDADGPKPLLLAAIGALAGIRPEDALELLKDLADSDDETIAMSKAFPEEEEEEGIWTGKID